MRRFADPPAVIDDANSPLEKEGTGGDCARENDDAADPTHQCLMPQRPEFHDFPPFFTLQPNLETRDVQLREWSRIICSFCQECRVFFIDKTSSTLRETFPFCNKKLPRTISEECLCAALDYMAKTDRGVWLNSMEYHRVQMSETYTKETILGRDSKTAENRPSNMSTSGGTSEATEADKSELFAVLWKTTSEWATVIYSWASLFRLNKVETEYWLTQGDDTVDQAFHGMPGFHLRMAIKELAKQDKAILFSSGQTIGIKFLPT